jgi:hypothetical protein
MRHIRRTTLATALVLGLLFAAPTPVPAQPAAPAGGQSAASVPTAADENHVAVRPGDLVTASGRIDSLIVFSKRKNGDKYKTKKIPMGTRLKPKGVTHSAYCERVAIANSLNVVIYDTWMRTVEVVEHEGFGLIADVEYDMQCNLIIADMGGDSAGRWPKDGKLWLRSPDGQLGRIGMNRNWVNPAFLDMDEWGTIYVVDKAAGPRMPGTKGQWHFDAIFKVGGPKYTNPIALYSRSGLNVTAFAVQPDSTYLVGNGDVLLLLEKRGAYPLCGGSNFSRINGVDINAAREVFIVDGFDLFEDTSVYRMADDYTCALDILADGKMVQGAQGLAAGLPRR